MFATMLRPARGGRGQLHPRKLYMWLMCALAGIAPLVGEAMPATGDKSADVLEFDPVFLPGGVDSVDLGRFSAGNHVAPGSYRVNIYLNGDPHGSETLRFESASPSESASACLSGEFLRRLGVLLPDDAREAACIDLPKSVSSAKVRFDTGEQRLDISVPQASLRKQARGYVDPSRWDDGITAGTLNYNLNVSRLRGRGRMEQSGYLGLIGGLNIGGWQFRHQSSLQWSDDEKALAWQNLRNYAQHDLSSLRSRLTIGDFITNGELFNAVALRGIQVASNDQMLPESQQGYAPVVRGIASSNAAVTIRQNGYVIYETNVAAGPFRIDDLYPAGYGGDLEVTVREAGGQEQSFSVPYGSVTRLLRPGTSRYSVAAGQYRDAEGGAHPVVLQGVWQRGLSNRVTAYGGALLAKDYQAAQLGAALSTGLGAFGLDVTHARTRLHSGVSSLQYYYPLGGGLIKPLRGVTRRGDSLRLSYSKTIAATGTNMSLAASRYSSGGYMSLHDALQSHDYGVVDLMRQRSSVQLAISQTVGNGSLYLSGSAQNYIGRGGVDSQFQFGYNGATRWFSYSISASRSRSGAGSMDNRAFVSLSIPLGGGSFELGSGLGRDGTDGHISFSRAMGEEASYGASLSRDVEGAMAWSVNGNYRSPLAVLTGSASGGKGYRQTALGAMGAAVVHAGGITLGQSAGDTIALVRAKDAAGAGIGMLPGARLNGRGYAIVPYLMPYRRNEIELNPQDISADVELLEGSHEVVPRSGAVVMAAFATRKGRVAVIDLKPAGSLAIPFGSDVFDSAGQHVGVVSQGARALVRGIAQEGRLTVRLDEKRTCHFHYKLPSENSKRGAGRDYVHMEAECDVSAGLVEAKIKGRGLQR